jgi:hypothetical protein
LLKKQKKSREIAVKKVKSGDKRRSAARSACFDSFYFCVDVPFLFRLLLLYSSGHIAGDDEELRYRL